MRAVVKFFRTTMLWIVLLPYALIFLGAASNQAVLIANHDTFPVLINSKKTVEMTSDQFIYIRGVFLPADPAILEDSDVVMLDEVHCVMTPQTHLNFLADIFDLRTAIYSIGDLLLGTGEWLLTFTFFVWVALIIRRMIQ